MQAMESQNFTENVRSLTREYGVVSRLADHVGVHRVQMSRMLHGHAQITLEQAEKIAHFLGFQLGQMLLPPEKFSRLAAIAIADRN